MSTRVSTAVDVVSLQTLLDGCCSGSILMLGEDGQFRLDTESTAVVQDIRLLSDILLDWKIWAKAEVDRTQIPPPMCFIGVLLAGIITQHTSTLSCKQVVKSYN